MRNGGYDRYYQLGSGQPTHSRCRRVRMSRRLVTFVSLLAFACLLVLVSIAVLLFIFLDVDSEDQNNNEYGSSSMSSIQHSDALKMIIIGDTGGLPVIHATRAQKKVAKAMSSVSRRHGLDLVLNMGDNVYFTGVDNEFDGRFESSFETPYRGVDLEVPWYIIAGNHDHFGNISAQVAYSKYSRKWKFPSLYYKVSQKTPDGATVDILMLDTIVLCGNSRDIQYAGFWKMVWAKSHDPLGPTNINAAEEQWKWIEEELEKSTADYLIVAGHYPIHSISSHGPTVCLKDRLDGLLHKHNVSVYFSGHDHTLQHIRYPNSIYGDRDVHYVVSGAGSRADPSDKHRETVQPPGVLVHRFPKTGWIIKQLGFGDAGFVYSLIDKNSLTMDFYDHKERKLHEIVIKPRHFISNTTTPPNLDIEI